MSPTLASEFFATEKPGKPLSFFDCFLFHLFFSLFHFLLPTFFLGDGGHCYLSFFYSDLLRWILRSFIFRSCSFHLKLQTWGMVFTVFPSSVVAIVPTYKPVFYHLFFKVLELLLFTLDHKSLNDFFPFKLYPYSHLIKMGWEAFSFLLSRGQRRNRCMPACAFPLITPSVSTQIQALQQDFPISPFSEFVQYSISIYSFWHLLVNMNWTE